MKIKKLAVLSVLFLSVFLGACGSKPKRVVTGQYYNPKQQESAADGEDTETAGVKETDTAETADTVASLGTDQFMIVSNDMTEECLVLKQLASGKEYVYNYTLATRFLDKYGNRATVSYFEPGRVISVREKDNQGKVMEVQISDKVWEYPDVTKYSVDEERGILQIAEDRYSYDENLFIHADGDVRKMSDLTEMDTIRLVGIGKELISVAVTTGHGELVLKNTELFEGSFIQVGSKIFAEITPDMTLEVPEGTYTVTVANKGYGGSTDITIESGKKKKLDLDKLKGEGPKIGNILFAVDVEGAILQIDGEVMDYSEAIPLQYGVHTLTVTANNYEPFSKKLFVNSEEATIVIGLSGDSGTAAEEETADTPESTENTAAENVEPGSLSGSLAGSQTSDSSAGALAGSQTSGVAGTDSTTSTGTGTDSGISAGTGSSTSTGTGSSTSTGNATDSSTDYLSTLSELLSLLTGESE